MKKSVIAALVLGLAAGAARAATYQVDPSHSTVGFSVRHMMVATVRGAFGEFSGSFDYDPENAQSFQASAVVQTASIDTRNAKRDEHLRGPDFFDAAQYPEITFQSTRVDSNGGDLILHGLLTMKGGSKEIAIPIIPHGPVTDPWGNVRAGFEGSATINRQDWGISWSKTLDGGGLVVSDEVKIEISIEGLLKQAE